MPSCHCCGSVGIPLYYSIKSYLFRRKRYFSCLKPNYMAKIKFGAGVLDMRGSIAGMTYSRNSSGAYARSKVTPVNVNSPSQTIARAAFGALSSAWRSLTGAERQSFIDQAPAYTNLNVFGDNVPLTGQQLFLRLNSSYQGLNGSLLTTCPPPVTVPAIGWDELQIDKSAATMEIADVDATDATTAGVIYATKPLSAGINFVGDSEFRVVGVIGVSTAAGAYDLKAGWESVFVTPIGSLTVGSKIFVRIVPVSTINGQRQAYEQGAGVVAA